MPQPPMRRATLRFLLSHPAHFIALGFGSGLSPFAPGTVGTLWAWVAFAVMQLWFTPATIGWIIAASLPIGWWACTVAARNMNMADPGAVVWDEVIAFWIVLWLGNAGRPAARRPSPLRCSVISMPPSPARWAGPTRCSSSAMRPCKCAGGARASASSSTTWWRRSARCWSLHSGAHGEPDGLFLYNGARRPGHARTGRGPGRLAAEKGWMLATAESCTGGLIGAACTELAGSSVWFERGFITYSNEAKTELLGVDAAVIAANGAVSEPVARAMATGAIAHSPPSRVALAVTGVAARPAVRPTSRWARCGSAGRSMALCAPSAAASTATAPRCARPRCITR